jgi:dihydrofolate reductase
MGKIAITEFMSIDGVIEDPGGSEDFKYGGWSFEFNRGDEGDKFKLNEVMEAEAHLLGRVTYEEFAAAWPSRDGALADKLNRDPKHVVSTTLREASWQNTTVIRRDVIDAISTLKDRAQGTILVAGSATLVDTLLSARLVDELRLMVFPTVLGRGRRLFSNHLDRVRFTLASSRTIGPDGVQLHIYEQRT